MLEKAATILPIWPPVADCGEQVILSNRNVVYCDVESGNSNPKVFTYIGNNVHQVSINSDYRQNKTVKLNVFTHEPTLVSVDMKYTGHEVSLRKTTPPTTKTTSDIVLLTATNEPIDTTHKIDESKTKSGINVHTNTKITAVLESKNHIFKTIPIIEEKSFLEPYKDLKNIFFAYGSSTYGYVIINSFNIINAKKSYDKNKKKIKT